MLTQPASTVASTALGKPDSLPEPVPRVEALHTSATVVHVYSVPTVVSSDGLTACEGDRLGASALRLTTGDDALAHRKGHCQAAPTRATAGGGLGGDVVAQEGSEGSGNRSSQSGQVVSPFQK